MAETTTETTIISQEHFEKHVDPGLRRRVRIYFVIAAALVLTVLYRIIKDGVYFFYPLIAFGVGIVIGLIVARMFKIDWDHDAQKVVSRLDAVGGVFLVFYVAFEIASHFFFETYFSGPSVLTMILAAIAGAIIGRSIGMLRRMVQVLRENI